jgi:lipoate-protein ligase A
MILLDNEGEVDPARNLALEEYALRELDPESSFLLLYVNRPSIVIGKNQNAFEEASLEQLRKRKLPLLRRISGGGTVYHDLGNLNFSFISRFKRGTLLRSRERLEPIVETLRSLGAAVELSERDNIFLEGRKISGNAQFTTTQRTLAHGTLLYSSNLNQISDALTPKEGVFTSRATASRRSPVTNLRPHIVNSAPELSTLRGALVLALLGQPELSCPIRRLTPEEWAAVDRLAEERYRSWDWNFGYFREFVLERKRSVGGIDVRMRLKVERGSMRTLAFESDGIPTGTRRALEAQLVGARYEAQTIEDRIKQHPPATGTIEDWRELIY